MSTSAGTEALPAGRATARLFRINSRQAAAGVLALALAGFEAWAFYFRLTLSLGPRVILQPALLRSGYALYETAIDIHTPLMPLLITALSPAVPEALRLAKLLVSGLAALTILLLFFIGAKRGGLLTGGLAAVSFAIWAPAFAAGKLWYEAFLSPLYLLYFIFFTTSPPARGWKWITALGLFAGVTVLIKQHSAFVFAAFLAWGLLYGWSERRPLRALLREALVPGVISFVPLGLFMLYQQATAGTLAGFFYWIFRYPLEGIYTDMAGSPPSLFDIKLVAASSILLLPALSCAAAWYRKKDPAWGFAGLGFTLILGIGVSAYPRFDLYHLLPALPAAALLGALALRQAAAAPQPARAFALGLIPAVLLFWGLMVSFSFEPLFNPASPREIAEFYPLVSLEASVRQVIGPDDCFFIYPDDEASSNLYALAGCRPPSYWIFHYPWYLTPAVQARILASLDENPPAWVVLRADKVGAAPNAVDEYLSAHFHVETQLVWSGETVRLLKRIQ